MRDAPVSRPPTVKSDSFLTLHYRLSDTTGREHVSTFDLSPATLQMGSGELAAPLEQCLLGLGAKQRREFVLAPDEAFGEYNPNLIERIARSALPADVELQPNSLIEFGAPGGAGFAGFLRELTETAAVFDFNHPLAGQTVRFEVEIIGIM
ncbi:MAG: FKBP-type peptidyl-prolyl cis-trans isomerase [Propionivibrio sp.]